MSQILQRVNLYNILNHLYTYFVAFRFLINSVFITDVAGLHKKPSGIHRPEIESITPPKPDQRCLFLSYSSA